MAGGEADVLGPVDDWLAELFDPVGIDTTISQLTEQSAQLQDPGALARAEAARARVAEYNAEISQYRASLKAGADPAVIGPWIAETQAKKVTAQADIRAATGEHHMSRDESQPLSPHWVTSPAWSARPTRRTSQRSTPSSA